MDSIEKLIREIQQQLLPYHHEHDIERGGKRWEIGRDEYITAWIVKQIRNCHERNRCEKKRLCVFYEYRDQARRNFDICYEILLRLESGDIRCTLPGEESVGTSGPRPPDSDT